MPSKSVVWHPSPTSGAILKVVEVQRQFQPAGGQNAQVCSKVCNKLASELLFRHSAATFPALFCDNRLRRNFRVT